MNKSAPTIVLLCASLCAAASASANEIYKWVDQEGNVHYGDTPTSDESNAVEIIEIASNRTVAENVQLEIDDRLEREAERDEAKALREEAEQEAAEAQAERDSLAEQCSAHRARLQKFNTARRLYKTDENGERVYLDEEEMQRARSELQASIQENCSGI